MIALAPTEKGTPSLIQFETNGLCRSPSRGDGRPHRGVGDDFDLDFAVAIALAFHEVGCGACDVRAEGFESIAFEVQAFNFGVLHVPDSPKQAATATSTPRRANISEGAGGSSALAASKSASSPLWLCPAPDDPWMNLQFVLSRRYLLLPA